MARVWRDGQIKPVWIYRLMAAGTIDEKIWQRQLRKLEVSASLCFPAPVVTICDARVRRRHQVADTVVDAKTDVSQKFSTDSLKDLFALYVAPWFTEDDVRLIYAMVSDEKSLCGTFKMLTGVEALQNENRVVEGWECTGEVADIEVLLAFVMSHFMRCLHTARWYCRTLC